MGSVRIWRVLVCVVMLVPWIQVNGQSNSVGARSASLAGISAGLEDAWAAANNPAGLARYDHLSIATNLEQRFLMKELGYYALAGSFPAGNGCLGISTMYSGYSHLSIKRLASATAGYSAIIYLRDQPCIYFSKSRK